MKVLFTPKQRWSSPKVGRPERAKTKKKRKDVGFAIMVVDLNEDSNLASDIYERPLVVRFDRIRDSVNLPYFPETNGWHGMVSLDLVVVINDDVIVCGTKCGPRFIVHLDVFDVQITP